MRAFSLFFGAAVGVSGTSSNSNLFCGVASEWLLSRICGWLSYYVSPAIVITNYCVTMDLHRLPRLPRPRNHFCVTVGYLIVHGLLCPCEFVLSTELSRDKYHVYNQARLAISRCYHNWSLCNPHHVRFSPEPGRRYYTLTLIDNGEQRMASSSWDLYWFAASCANINEEVFDSSKFELNVEG